MVGDDGEVSPSTARASTPTPPTPRTVQTTSRDTIDMLFDAVAFLIYRVNELERIDHRTTRTEALRRPETTERVLRPTSSAPKVFRPVETDGLCFYH